MGAGMMFIEPRSNRTLILKRALDPNDPRGGTWNFAGGGGEEGESDFETAVREAEEEVGPLPDYRVYDDIPIKGYRLFLATVEDIWIVRLDNEHTDFKWVRIEDLPRYNIHPKDLQPLQIMYPSLWR